MRFLKYTRFLLSLSFSNIQAKPNVESSVMLVKGKCGDSPFEICKKAGLSSIGADVNNMEALLRMLKKKNIESAAVAAWNQVPADLILRQNGALAPHNAVTNDSNHAFCFVSCPCPDYENQIDGSKSSKPTSSKPLPPSKSPFLSFESSLCCPMQGYKKPCNKEKRSHHGRHEKPVPKTIVPSKSPKDYPVSFKVIENSPKLLAKKDILCQEIEKGKITRHYVLDAEKLRNKKSEVRLEIMEKKGSIDTKKVLLSGSFNSKSLYPNILRHPESLIKISRCISKKYDCEPYFYVGGRCCDQLFVYLNHGLYYVPLSSKQLSRRHVDCNSISIRKVDNHKVEKLVKKGLAKIVLKGIDYSRRR